MVSFVSAVNWNANMLDNCRQMTNERFSAASREGKMKMRLVLHLKIINDYKVKMKIHELIDTLISKL